MKLSNIVTTVLASVLIVENALSLSLNKSYIHNNVNQQTTHVPNSVHSVRNTSCYANIPVSWASPLCPGPLQAHQHPRLTPTKHKWTIRLTLRFVPFMNFTCNINRNAKAKKQVVSTQYLDSSHFFADPHSEIPLAEGVSSYHNTCQIFSIYKYTF